MGCQCLPLQVLQCKRNITENRPLHIIPIVQTTIYNFLQTKKNLHLHLSITAGSEGLSRPVCLKMKVTVK